VAGKVRRKDYKVSLHQARELKIILPICIMLVLCSILNSAYYANSYAGIFDAGLQLDLLCDPSIELIMYSYASYFNNVCIFAILYFHEEIIAAIKE